MTMQLAGASMSAATQNHVDTLIKDLKQAKETIKELQDTVCMLERENSAYALQEGVLLARLRKLSETEKR